MWIISCVRIAGTLSAFVLFWHTTIWFISVSKPPFTEWWHTSHAMCRRMSNGLNEWTNRVLLLAWRLSEFDYQHTNRICSLQPSSVWLWDCSEYSRKYSAHICFARRSRLQSVGWTSWIDLILYPICTVFLFLFEFVLFVGRTHLEQLCLYWKKKNIMIGLSLTTTTWKILITDSRLISNRIARWSGRYE